MNGTRNVCEVGFAGLVLAGDFDAVADLDVGFNKLAHSLGRPAIGWGHAGDDMKYMQVEARNSWVSLRPNSLVDLAY
jgi:hypothetical protein